MHPGKKIIKKEKTPTLYSFDCWTPQHSGQTVKIFELELLPWYEERFFVIPMSVGFASCETIPPMKYWIFRLPESFLSTLQGCWLQQFYISNIYILYKNKNMHDKKRKAIHFSLIAGSFTSRQKNSLELHPQVFGAAILAFVSQWSHNLWMSLVLHFCCTQQNFSRKLVIVSFILAIPACVFCPAFHLFSLAHRHCFWVTQSHIRNLVYPWFCSLCPVLAGSCGVCGQTHRNKQKEVQRLSCELARTHLFLPVALGVAMTLLEICAVCRDAPGGVDMFGLLRGQSHPCRSARDLAVFAQLPACGRQGEGLGMWKHQYSK